MVTEPHPASRPHKRLTVHRGKVGWELREEVDSRIVRTATLRDWHRVERALAVFELEIEGEAPGTAPAKV
jgi:hypothetical protein